MAYNAKIHVGGFNRDCLSRETTAAVKGCFLIFVFLRHFTQYVSSWNNWDFVFVRFDRGLSQMLVTMFLFYSGYGIAEAVKHRGAEYVKGMPRRRILSVLIQFDIAVALFLITGLLLGKSFSLKTILPAFVGCTSLGNSNWYIFAVLMMYVISFAAFFVCKNKFAAAAVLTALCAVYIIVVSRFKEPYWYNTVICYPLGVWWSLIFDKTKGFLNKKFVCTACLGLSSAAYFLLDMLRTQRAFERSFLLYELMTVAFTLAVLFFTGKVSFGNSVTRYLGNHLFSLYILQRIPMMIFSRTALIDHKIAFLVVCAAVTLAMGALFDIATAKLMRLLRIK